MSWSRRGSGLLAAGALLLAGGLVAPTTASAAPVTFTDSAGITYEADDGDVSAGATVRSYSNPGPGSAVTIPDTVEINSITYDVTLIWQSAFDVKGLTDVTIGDNVRTIKSDAFRGNAIDTLELGASVESVGQGSFADNNLQTLVLPNSVTEVASSAFSDNEIDTLDLGNSVHTIRTEAFENNKLTDVDFPDSVIFIGWRSFRGNQLQTVEIPNQVTEIGPGAFEGNPALESVVFTGPAPTVDRASSPRGSSFDTSNSALVLTYPWAYGHTQTAGGYEPSVWEGYATEAVATIDFDLNGQGSSAPANQDVVVDELATEPTAPNASGYVFMGWFTDAALTDQFDFSTPVPGDITLYAGWQVEQEGPEDYLSVSKTVDASYVRVFDWDLTKSGQVGEVTVDGDTASADVDYTVTATPQGDRNAYHVLRGEITVTNNYLELMSYTITDEPEVGVDATCSVSNSDGAADGDISIAALGEMTFDYLCTLDGIPEDGTNTVEVSWAGGEGQASVTEDVIFEERDTSFDTVNIGDDKTTPDSGFVELGTAQWGADGIPAEFNYTLTQPDLPVAECTSFTNTAMIAQTEQTAEATVEICPEAATDPGPTPTPDPDPTADPDPTPSVDPEVPVQAETNSLPKTGMDAGGLVGAALLFIGAGGAAVMIRRKVRN